jgi:hypothetical protein
VESIGKPQEQFQYRVSLATSTPVRAGLRRTVRSIARSRSTCAQQERMSGINDWIAVALISTPGYVVRPRLNSSNGGCERFTTRLKSLA